MTKWPLTCMFRCRSLILQERVQAFSIIERLRGASGPKILNCGV